MDEHTYVRLKPYNPRQGLVVKRYLYKGANYVYDQNAQLSVWYRVTPQLANELRELRQVEGDGLSAQLFDVYKETEKRQIEEEEERRRLVQMGLISATAVQPRPAAVTVDRSGGRAAAIPAPQPHQEPVNVADRDEEPKASFQAFGEVAATDVVGLQRRRRRAAAAEGVIVSDDVTTQQETSEL